MTLQPLHVYARNIVYIYILPGISLIREKRRVSFVCSLYTRIDARRRVSESSMSNDFIQFVRNYAGLDDIVILLFNVSTMSDDYAVTVINRRIIDVVRHITLPEAPKETCLTRLSEK